MGNITYPSISSFVSAHASDDQQGQSSLSYTFLLFSHSLRPHPTHSHIQSFTPSSSHTFSYSLIHSVLIPHILTFSRSLCLLSHILIFTYSLRPFPTYSPIQSFTFLVPHILIFCHSLLIPLILPFSHSLRPRPTYSPIHSFTPSSSHSFPSFTQFLLLLCALCSTSRCVTVFIINSCLSVMPLSVTLASVYN